MFTEAKNFTQRLTEVEKIDIRGASQGRLEWLFNAVHQFEFNLPVDEARKTFFEACEQVNAQFKEQSAENEFGKTWRF
jgi:hypothetical protein